MTSLRHHLHMIIKENFKSDFITVADPANLEWASRFLDVVYCAPSPDQAEDRGEQGEGGSGEDPEDEHGPQWFAKREAIKKKALMYFSGPVWLP